MRNYIEKSIKEKNENERKTIIIDNKEFNINVMNYLNDPLVMAIQIIDKESGELYDCLTTNLGTNNGNDAVMGKGKSHVNSGNKTLLKMIDNYQLGKVDMRFGEPVINYSGFNSYLLYDFNLDVLAEYDKEGVDEYKKNYDENFASELERFRSEMFGINEEDFEI